jgi:hypothetical protein
MPERFVPLRQIAPHVSPATEAWVMKALELSVSERWQSAQAMLTGIDAGPTVTPTVQAPSPQIAQTVQQPVSPRPVTSRSSPAPSEPASPERKRPVWLFVLIGVVVCGVLSCLSVFVGGPILSALIAPDDPTSTPLPPATATSTPTPPPLPTATDASLPTATPGERSDDVASIGAFEITLENRSPYAVCYVFISSSDADQWGEDRLDLDEVIGTGQRRVFEIEGGPHDLMAKTCDEGVLLTGWEISGDQALVVGGDGLLPLWVVNDLNTTVCYVYASLETSDDWGMDWLGDGEVLSSGDSRIIFLPEGIYDMMAEDCDGESVSTQFSYPVDGEAYWYLSGGGP